MAEVDGVEGAGLGAGGDGVDQDDVGAVADQFYQGGGFAVVFDDFGIRRGLGLEPIGN